MKKEWLNPSVEELSVKDTMLGFDMTPNHDGAYVDDQQGNRYYSYS